LTFGLEHFDIFDKILFAQIRHANESVVHGRLNISHATAMLAALKICAKAFCRPAARTFIFVDKTKCQAILPMRDRIIKANLS